MAGIVLRRLVGLVAVLFAVLLAMWGLRNQASFFYTPADIAVSCVGIVPSAVFASSR